MDCALPALFVVIIYFMGGLRLTAAAFLSNLAALVRAAMEFSQQHSTQCSSVVGLPCGQGGAE